MVILIRRKLSTKIITNHNLQFRLEANIFDKLSNDLELPTHPKLFNNLTNTWRAHERWTSFTNLKQYYGGVWFLCRRMLSEEHPMIMTLDQFLTDMPSSSTNPAYIFDGDFQNECSELAHDYEIPSIFQNDVIERLPKELRPDHKWFLVGDRGTGSRLHVDPLATDAWNALIRGHKRWLFISPTSPDITSMLTSQENVPSTLMDVYMSQVLPERIARAQQADPGIIVTTALQSPGQTIFVPHGWLHAVENLDFTVAVTHNFIKLSRHEKFLDEYRKSDHLTPNQFTTCRQIINEIVK